MDAAPQNSADRLLAILNKLSDKSPNVGAAWREALGVEDKRTHIYRAILDLSGLVRELEMQLARAKMTNAASANHAIVAVRSLYEIPVLDQAWAPFWPTVISVRISIALLADFLRVAGIEEVQLTREQIANLLEKVDALFNEVSNEAIPEPLRTFLLELIEQMRRALNCYHIYGWRYLIDSLGIGGARLAFHPIAVQADKDIKSKSFLQKARDVIDKIKDAVAIAEAGQKAIESGKHIIESVKHLGP